MKKSTKTSIGGRPKAGNERFTAFGKKMKALQGKYKNSDFQVYLGGIAPSAYSGYLNGRSAPDAKQLASLRQNMGVDLNWLIMDEDVRPGPILVHGPGVEKTPEIAAVSEAGQVKWDTPSPEAKTIPLLERALDLAEQHARELATQLKRSNERGDSAEARNRKLEEQNGNYETRNLQLLDQNMQLLDQNMKLQAALMAAQGGDGSKKRGVGA